MCFQRLLQYRHASSSYIRRDFAADGQAPPAVLRRPAALRAPAELTRPIMTLRLFRDAKYFYHNAMPLLHAVLEVFHLKAPCQSPY